MLFIHIMATQWLPGTDFASDLDENAERNI